MHKNRPKTWAHIALIVAYLIYGANFCIAKILMPDYINPLVLVLLRTTVAAALFWITSFFIPREKVTPKDLLKLFACSFFGIVINQTLFLVGLNLTTPVNSSIVQSTVPIFTFVFAAIILKESLTLLKIGGMALGLLGVVLLILHNGAPSLENSTFLGDLVTLINVTSWSFFTVAAKGLVKKYHAVTVMKWTFLFSLLTTVPLGLSKIHLMNWSAITPGAWAGIFFVVVLATYVGYLLITFGLKPLSPTIVGTYSYTQPIIAAFIASLIGQDRINLIMIISALLIFAGVFVVSLQKEKQ
jgi:drug/metabolite transporter (DMT)-like permease